MKIPLDVQLVAELFYLVKSLARKLKIMVIISKCIN